MPRDFLPESQATYSGFVKPREANHDANLYLLYQKEASQGADNTKRPAQPAGKPS